jgi:hypothetical protein
MGQMEVSVGETCVIKFRIVRNIDLADIWFWHEPLE